MRRAHRIALSLMSAVALTAGCSEAGSSAGAAAEPPKAAASSASSGGAKGATEQMRQLEWFAGKWQCTSKNTPPGGKPYESTLKATGAFDLDGSWFIWRSQEQPSAAVPNPISFMGVWGYDHSTKKYVTSHFDNTGLRALQYSPGWNGEVFDLTEGTLYLQDRGAIPFREIFTRTGPDSFTDDMRFQLGTTWHRIIIADCKRQR